MAGQHVVLTGDNKLNAILRELPGRVVDKFVRRAIKPAADMVLSEARARIPVRATNRNSKGRHPPGSWKSSLVVEPTRKSKKKGIGFRVTQRGISGYPADSKIRGFYGAFQELGYFHTGRVRKANRDSSGAVTEFKRKHALALKPFDSLIAKYFPNRKKNDPLGYGFDEVKTYRNKTFTIHQLRAARKMKGRWIMRGAGKAKEADARALYAETLRSIVNEEANGGK